MEQTQKNSPEIEAFATEKLKDPRIVQAMESMQPEEKANFMRQLYQDYSGQGRMNDQAMSRADALRNTKTGAHGPSAMSGAAHVLNQYNAGRMDREARASNEALSKDRTEGLSQYASILAQPPAGPQMSPAMPQDRQLSIAELMRQKQTQGG